MDRPVIYARVSRDGQTVEQQVNELRARYGAGIPSFHETESSRKHRPVQEDVVRRAIAGEFDAVIVWKVDRFARSHRELVNLVDDLDKAGVTFVSLQDGIDLSTPTGRFVFRILAAVAELERDMISMRTRSKLAQLKAEGRAIGRPRTVSLEAARASAHLSVKGMGAALGVSERTAKRLRAELKSVAKGPKPVVNGPIPLDYSDVNTLPVTACDVNIPKKQP